MPTPYIKKIAAETGRDVASVEADWERAKAIVAKEYGEGDHYAIVTSVFKNMVHGKHEDAAPDIDEAAEMARHDGEPVTAKHIRDAIKHVTPSTKSADTSPKAIRAMAVKLNADRKHLGKPFTNRVGALMSEDMDSGDIDTGMTADTHMIVAGGQGYSAHDIKLPVNGPKGTIDLSKHKLTPYKATRNLKLRRVGSGTLEGKEHHVYTAGAGEHLVFSADQVKAESVEEGTVIAHQDVNNHIAKHGHYNHLLMALHRASPPPSETRAHLSNAAQAAGSATHGNSMHAPEADAIVAKHGLGTTAKALAAHLVYKGNKDKRDTEVMHHVERAYLHAHESVATSSYHDVVAARDHAEAEHKAASAALDKHPRQSNGLHADHVRTSPEYQEDKARVASTFAALRHVNSQLLRHPDHMRLRKRKHESVDEVRIDVTYGGHGKPRHKGDHGGYPSAYAQGRASAHSKRPRVAPMHYSPGTPDHKDFLKGHDDVTGHKAEAVDESASPEPDYSEGHEHHFSKGDHKARAVYYADRESRAYGGKSHSVHVTPNGKTHIVTDNGLHSAKLRKEGYKRVHSANPHLEIDESASPERAKAVDDQTMVLRMVDTERKRQEAVAKGLIPNVPRTAMHAIAEYYHSEAPSTASNPSFMGFEAWLASRYPAIYGALTSSPDGQETAPLPQDARESVVEPVAGAERVRLQEGRLEAFKAGAWAIVEDAIQPAATPLPEAKRAKRIATRVHELVRRIRGLR